MTHSQHNVVRLFLYQYSVQFKLHQNSVVNLYICTFYFTDMLQVQHQIIINSVKYLKLAKLLITPKNALHNNNNNNNNNFVISHSRYYTSKYIKKSLK